ncbi:MAG: hypothetical protein AAGA99_18545 [Actinomycetota bacterium]
MDTARRRVTELRGRMMVSLVNRTFKRNPSFVDRIAITVLGRALGPVPELDESFSHDPHPRRSAA